MRRACWVFFALFSLYLTAHLCHLIPVAEGREITWTNPGFYADTCDGDSIKPIPDNECVEVLVQLRAEADTTWETIGSVPWLPGTTSTFEVVPIDFGTWHYRVVQVAVFSGPLGGDRGRCPSNVWTWTITDTCVARSTFDLGPTR